MGLINQWPESPCFLFESKVPPHSLEELRPLLPEFVDRSGLSVVGDKSCDAVLGVRIRHDEVLRAWDYMRRLVPTTGRVPLVVCSWMGKGEGLAPFADSLDRRSFAHEHLSRRSGSTVEDVLQASNDASIYSALESVARRFDEYGSDFENAIDETVARFGSGPSLEELTNRLGLTCPGSSDHGLVEDGVAVG